MDHDQAQQALHAGELTEAVIRPAQNANGWIILLTHKSGEHLHHTGHRGNEKVYHSLDRATGVARELGFDSIRIEEEF